MSTKEIFTPEERLEIFKEEIGLIKSASIKNYAIGAINSLPNYFFYIPASSTGKYHPDYALGDGGLVRHTKVAVRFLVECFRLAWYERISDDDRDLLVVALMLHDGWKSGISHSKYTLDEHPVIAIEQLKNNEEINTLLPSEQLELIYSCIETHMGQWNISKKTFQEFAPVPATSYQKLIHFCDYVASRKLFEANFDYVPTRS